MVKDIDPRTENQLEELAETRNALRETWPSLTDADISDFPNDRNQAAELIRRRTGAALPEIETRLSEIYGMDPARHEPDLDEGTDVTDGKKAPGKKAQTRTTQTEPHGEERKSA